MTSLQQLTSVQNFQQIEKEIVGQLFQQFGQYAGQLPTKQVRRVIYGNLTELKEHYLQNQIPINVGQINNQVFNYSVQQLGEHLQENYAPPPSGQQFQTQPTQVQQNYQLGQPQNPDKDNKAQEIQDRFQQLQQDRKYEGYIPMTDQQQGRNANLLDTREFQQVQQPAPQWDQTEVQKLLTPIATKEDQAQMDPTTQNELLQQTEKQFQERLMLMQQQEQEFATVQYEATQGGDGSGGGSGGGGLMETLLKPGVPPTVILTKRYVVLFSGNRDYSAYPNRYQYNITLEREITKVKKIRILKLVVPTEINQRRYIENGTITHLENLRDFFMNYNYSYEQGIIVNFRNVNNTNQNNTPEQYHTVVATFQAQNEHYRGRDTKVYGNASDEVIDYGGSVLENLQQFEIELRNTTGEIYKNDQLDNFRMTDVIGSQTNDVSNPNNATVTTFTTLQIALNRPFEVNQFFMGDVVRFMNTTITVQGLSSDVYVLSESGITRNGTATDSGTASADIDATGNYTLAQMNTVLAFFQKRSGYQIVEVYQHLNNLSNSFYIQIPASVINPGGTSTSIPEYEYDQTLIDAFNALREAGAGNAQVQSNVINLSLQHTIIAELEQESTTIDNSQLQI